MKVSIVIHYKCLITEWEMDKQNLFKSVKAIHLRLKHYQNNNSNKKNKIKTFRRDDVFLFMLEE